ncbi:Glutathione gamma-glutamylcysteinyltransferase 2 [Holothuria leucospilota]|uniref:glutathione gamma-glutamylcysteinyltransferase n=1 Tax=Holothuria leucospilota TaxID=206669 RepID=A0A9Q1BVQ9_HOLLE|nr:Glutathione gamma-glutamylcysteinyltransferase 2 [Holothuria leucospilota]
MSGKTIFKVPFHSEEGMKILSESISQPLIIKMFKKQENNSFCGIHSCAMLMSAQVLGKDKTVSEIKNGNCDISDAPYVESNMFDFPETRQAIKYEVADDVGLTLDETYELFKAHGKNIKRYYAADISVEEFRSLAVEALTQENSSHGVIVNFHESQLQQCPDVEGHFSPLAGYHKERDLFLLLDTWFETTDSWVGTKDLFDAMNTVDSDSGKSRGLLVLEP